MGVDVIDFLRRRACIGQRPTDSAGSAVTSLIRLDRVESVAGRAVARHLRQNCRASVQGVLQALQDQNGRALRRHKAVPLGIEGAACLVRLLVAGTESLEDAETGQAQLAYAGLGAARQNNVDGAATDGLSGLPDGLVGGRAGGDNSRVVALGPKDTGDVGSCHIRQYHRDEEGVDLHSALG